MALAYQLEYNEEVIKKGYPYNIDALKSLDENFQAAFTSSVECVLKTKPENPVRFIAEQLKEFGKKKVSSHQAMSSVEASIIVENSNSSLVPNSSMVFRDQIFEIPVTGGIKCKFRSLKDSTHSTKKITGIPLMYLHSPSSFEIESALSNLEILSASEASATGTEPHPTLIFVEPLSSPSDLLFLKGFPYESNLTELLENKIRRGEDVAHLSRVQAAMKRPSDSLSSLSQQLIRELFPEKEAQFLEDILRATVSVDIKPTTINPNSFDSNSPLDSPPHFASRYLEVFSPLQQSYLDQFDTIFRGFNRATAPRTNVSKLQTVSLLFISFQKNKEIAAVTLSRIVAAYIPYYEEAQRRVIEQIRIKTLERRSACNIESILKYWSTVAHRRETKDETRGSRKGYARKLLRQTALGDAGKMESGVTITNSNSQSNLNTSDIRSKEDVVLSKKQSNVGSLHSTRSAACLSELRKMAAAARDARRQQEDTVFLEVLKRIRVNAAVKLQSWFRGHLVRRNVSFVTKKNERSTRDAPLWASPPPEGLPPLLAKSLIRLGEIHGELLGNYHASLPPFPRRISVFTPFRRSIPSQIEGEPDSETEDWKEEELFLPPLRHCRPFPHFNPLQRLLEIHRLVSCNMIEKAINIQKQCSGFSLLQRRAYDTIKSAILSLFFISFIELHHRKRLPEEIQTFSMYVTTYFQDLIECFSLPHMASRAYRVQEKSRNNDSPLSETQTKPQICTIFNDEVLRYERVLIPCWNGNMKPDDVNVLQVTPASLGADPSATFNSTLENQTTSKFTSEEVLEDREGNLELLLGPSIAHNVYIAPSFLSRDKWLSVLVMMSKCSKASALDYCWWSLCPCPSVYISGYPLVLTPRQARQSVMDRAGYDEYVPYTRLAPKPMKSVRITPERESPEPENEGFKKVASMLSQTTINDIPAGSNRGSPTFSYNEVCDDSPVLSESNALDSQLDISLQLEEVNLKRVIKKQLFENGQIVVYSPPQFYSPRTEDGTATRTGLQTAPSEKFPVFPLIYQPSASHVPSYYELSMANELHPYVLDKETIDHNSRMKDTEHGTTVSTSHSMRKRTFLRGEGWTKALERTTSRINDISSERISAKDAAITVVGTEPIGPVSRRELNSMQSGQGSHSFSRSSPLDDIQTLSEVLKDLTKLSSVSGFTLEHYRPCFFPTSSGPWLPRFEQFLEIVFQKLKKESTIILACDDPFQRIYPLAVALIQREMERVEVEENKALALRLVPDSASQAAIQFSERTSIVMVPNHGSDEAERFSFFDEFYTLLQKRFKKAGIAVEDCVTKVKAVLIDFNLRVGKTYDDGCAREYLTEIRRYLEAAESELDPDQLPNHIIKAVCLSEHYCWLLALQIFMSTQQVKEACSRKSTSSPLPSFSSFVKHSDVILPWIESINPWKYTPFRCPDTSHLRYSNGLRRWDNRDYISFGAY